jgi:hypothetical protein
MKIKMVITGKRLRLSFAGCRKFPFQNDTDRCEMDIKARESLAVDESLTNIPQSQQKFKKKGVRYGTPFPNLL